MTSQIVLKYPEQPCSPEDMQDLSCPNLFLNREINWLDFNAKVLDEALSPQQPLLEQLKFLAIFYNNLDEFFMVRVANILRQYRNGAPNGSADRITPAKQLDPPPHPAADLTRAEPLAQEPGPATAGAGRAHRALHRPFGKAAPLPGRLFPQRDLSRAHAPGHRPGAPLPHHFHHLPQFHHPAAQPRQRIALRAPQVPQQRLALHLHPAQQGGQDLRLPGLRPQRAR